MKRRVLVVEDSKTVNRWVCDTLGEQGFECFQAFDGDEALQLFSRISPEAVVLDLNIPKIHGTEVLRRIKGINPFTVVVVLTGHGSDQTAMQALKLGADDYLTKPLRQAHLAQVLRVHIERASLQRELDLPVGCPTDSEARHLSTIFYNAPAALIHVDADKIITAMNRAASRLLAVTPEKLLGRPLTAIVPEDVGPGWMDTLNRLAPCGKGYAGEVHVRRGKEVFPAYVDAVGGEDPGHLILSIRDLSRQKALEERYYESKKLASLGRVVEGVAHEVRNPLISIGGFARKLLAKSKEETRDHVYLEVIVSEVERLEQMVRDIEGYVQFTKLHRPSFAPVCLREILEFSVESQKKGNGAGGAEVVLDTPAKLPSIFADRQLLEELFSGLLENAVDAMPAGGTVNVASQIVDGWIQTTVTDTGVGIPAADLEEIFDPFFTSKTSGTGLGLAKAYMIVEEHAGTIDFESTVDRGTTCTVSLPVDRRKVVRGA